MRKKLHIVLILILSLMWLILPQGVCLGATYYVDTVNGDDSLGDGSKGNPWQTVGKAKSSVSAGDTVNLLLGNYGSVTFGEAGDSYGTSGNYITYQSYPDPYGAKFTNIHFEGDHDFYITISGLDVNSTGQYAIDTYGYGALNYVKIINCKAYGPPEGAGPSWACIFARGSQHILVEDCEMYHGNEGFESWGGDDITVRGCHVHDIIGSGIRTGGGVNYVFEYNVVHDQRAHDWDPEAHGSGFSIHSHNTTIRGNIIYNYGNTRPICFYWSYAGPDGYHDMLVENNLVYETADFKGTMWWSEFRDVGPNCVIRNNTFIGGVQIYFAQNQDGSGLHLYNNIFKNTLSISTYDATNASPPHSLWGNIYEGTNIYNDLCSIGCGWMCPAPDAKFSPDSTSIEASGDGYWDVGTFFQSDTGNYPYQLCEGSPAIGFADPARAPATDILGNPRDAQPDAGCYEYGGNQQPTANAGPDQTITYKDKDGKGQVTLDGSRSFDPDGEIVSLVWSEGGAQIATGVNPTVILSTGTHLITLTVTDDEGLKDTDTVTIKVLKEDTEFGELPTGCYNDIFNPTKGEKAVIVVKIEEQARVSIGLYDIRGNRIRELADEEKEAGTHKYYWDGKSGNGDVVGSGLYFVHIQAGDYKKVKKIVVVK